MKRISILLVDDNAVVRGEYKRLLGPEADLEVVGEAKNGFQAVDMVKKLLPAVVLMDINMPLMNGLKATQEILKAVPSTKVIMLSVHTDAAYVDEAIKNGAMGYLVKETAVDVLCPAIREVQKGKTFFSPSLSRRFHKSNRKV